MSAATVATRFHTVDGLIFLSTLKPVSLLLLSVQISTILAVVADAIVNPTGAEGVGGITFACATIQDSGLV